jgi:hypothetical protein
MELSVLEGEERSRKELQNGRRHEHSPHCASYQVEGWTQAEEKAPGKYGGEEA